MMRWVVLAALVAASSAAAQTRDGKTVYQAECKKCHGVRGIPPQTMKKKYKDLPVFDAQFFAGRSDDSVVTVLTKGKGDDMKPFDEKLTREEMAAVAKYIRELVGKAEPAGTH